VTDPQRHNVEANNGKSGRWDLSQILSWRLTRDARARGVKIDETPISIQVDRELGRLAEEWGNHQRHRRRRAVEQELERDAGRG
jgi:hypothetical protein